MCKKSLTTKEMIKTLRYKANNIKAHIEPEFFFEVANRLEKQVAKKPKVLINDKDVKVGCVTFRKGVKTYKCICGCWITLSQDYCNCCGQKLDWSEVIDGNENKGYKPKFKYRI